MESGKGPVKRDPQATRSRLLQAAFREVYKAGFQSSDLDAVPEQAGVTKGALYYHFPNKEALGHAVVTEVIARIMRDKWLRPLDGSIDPIKSLIGVVESTSEEVTEVRGGCPLNNLAQEMSGLDEGFRSRIAKIFEDWRGGIAVALRGGQKRGLVRKDADVDEAATYLVATYEGYISMAKVTQDVGVLQAGKRTMVRYLQSLSMGINDEKKGKKYSR